jgi:GntR family histidine utilization transcriptional repressor
MEQLPLPRATRDEPLHLRIEADIEARILSGAWPPGTRIPNETELAGLWGCARMTVNKALTRLAERGLIDRRRRSGSTVRGPGSQSAVLEIRDIRTEVEATGRPYRYERLSRSRRRATGADQSRLGLGADASVLALTCRHMAGETPFCLEDRVINLAAVPEAATQDFIAEAPGSWLIGRVPWSAAEHVIRSVGADAPTAGRLGVATGAPCLVVERRTTAGGAWLTHVQLTYPGDRHALVARFAPARSGP